jgi:hypothetical protein
MSEEESASNTDSASKEMLVLLIGSIFDRGKQELKRLATDGRRRLDLRSLQKDRAKMYEKLGREVENLFAAGEISHPGLARGVERIQDLDKEISAIERVQE